MAHVMALVVAIPPTPGLGVVIPLTLGPDEVLGLLPPSLL